jgi:outer membrane protein OmpA-like peptidoglycan-associated protein
LSKESIKILNQIIQIICISKNKIEQIKIIANAHDKNNTASNRILSQQCAYLVKKYLINSAQCQLNSNIFIIQALGSKIDNTKNIIEIKLFLK